MLLTSKGKPIVYEDDGNVSLYFGAGATQSKMKINDPYRLMLGYTRTMMGFLVFNPYPAQITIIGLGGGSLPKYCYRHLPESQITVVEIRLEVIALRDRFQIPPNDERLTVLCEDGAEYMQRSLEPIDILMVDGFDESSQDPELGSQSFYDACYEALDANGVMVVNFFGTDTNLNTYMSRIHQSFKGQLVVVEAEDSSNKIVFAGKGKAFRLSAKILKERVQQLEIQYPIDFRRVGLAVMRERL